MAGGCPALWLEGRRRYSWKCSANGVTSYAYKETSDLLATVTTPAPAPGEDQLVTTYTSYDALGRPAVVTQPDSTTVITEYYDTGEVKKTYGSRTYPVEYTYDYAGRMKTMTTWQSFNASTGEGISGSAVTTWNYDPYRGWLVSKDYANPTTGNAGSIGTDYTYTAGGRLKSRTWARSDENNRVVTWYNYGFDCEEFAPYSSDLVEVRYENDPANTPPIVYDYDRQGRLKSVVTGSATTTLAYTPAGLLQSESYSGSGSVLAGLSVTNAYDEFLRRTNLALLSGSTLRTATRYGYDGAGRLGVVTALSDQMSPVVSAGYEYVANSALVGQIRFSNSTARVMVTTRSNDYVNRLRWIATTNMTPSILSSNIYGYNLASQRTAMTNGAGYRWEYDYDSLGQVIKGWQYDPAEALVSGRDFAYEFDDIGNRKTATIGGTEVEYEVNRLNQYTRVDSEEPTYDADGNEVSDGEWARVWDAENRLITTFKNGKRVKFTYDYKGRRVQKRVWDSTEETGAPVLDHRFVYDGWNVIAVLDGNTGGLPVAQSFTWGKDLSGSLEGAGGVGGLLAVNDATLGTHFCCFDGNGNVMKLVYASGQNAGTESAAYEYGPFGEVVSKTGAMGTANAFRFSTKYQDDETGLLYYGLRYLRTSTGGWPNRDPIAERGGRNLYGFVDNNPLMWVDLFGLRTFGLGGQLCVSANCKASALANFTYIAEDPPAVLHTLPPPGQCVEADAVYYPGGAKKITDCSRMVIKCDANGDPLPVSGGSSTWPAPKPGQPPSNPPPRWPSPNIPPYPTTPPGNPEPPGPPMPLPPTFPPPPATGPH
jgi:RHS repeat-associated protein